MSEVSVSNAPSGRFAITLVSTFPFSSWTSCLISVASDCTPSLETVSSEMVSSATVSFFTSGIVSFDVLSSSLIPSACVSPVVVVSVLCVSGSWLAMDSEEVSPIRPPSAIVDMLVVSIRTMQSTNARIFLLFSLFMASSFYYLILVFSYCTIY